VFQRRDVQASDEIATGYDEHQPRIQSGKETSVFVKAASHRHRLGVTIGVFVDRKAPQHGAKAVFLILLFQRSTVETPTFCRRHGGTLFELLFLCAICGTAFAYPFFFFALHFFDFVSRSYFERGLFYWQALGLLCLCVFMDIDMCCLGPLPPIFRNEEDLLLFFF
jgi:hypothetical protein